MEENRKKFLESRVKNTFLVYKEDKLSKFTLKQEINDMRDDWIPDLLTDNAELREKCQKYETLRELAEELKKFNVEEMLIIRKTNEQINEKVIEFEK